MKIRYSLTKILFTCQILICVEERFPKFRLPSMRFIAWIAVEDDILRTQLAKLKDLMEDLRSGHLIQGV